MLKVYIKMDEEKIRQDGVYAVEDILYTIDKAFADFNLVKGSDGTYLEKGTDQDYAHFWSVILSFAETRWFMDYVKEWLWFNSDDGRDENDFSIEDLATFFRKKKLWLENKKAIA